MVDQERLAEIDREIEALGTPSTDLDALVAQLRHVDLEEADSLLAELAEGQEIQESFASFPTEEISARDIETFDLPPPAEAEPEAKPEAELQTQAGPSESPPAASPPEEEDLLGSVVESLGTSEYPEPMDLDTDGIAPPPEAAPKSAPSVSMASFIDPPTESESPAPFAGESFAEEDEGEFVEERTGLFSQEDIDAIRRSSAPPPGSVPPAAFTPPAMAAAPSMPPPVPAGPPPVSVLPPPPIPSAPPSAPPSTQVHTTEESIDMELDALILDDDDFELMIDDDDDEAASDVPAVDHAAAVAAAGEDDDEDDDFDDGLDDDPTMIGSLAEMLSQPPPEQEPSIIIEGDAPATEAEPSAEAAPEDAADAAGAGEEGEGEGEEGEGDKKGFFKKLFG